MEKTTRRKPPNVTKLENKPDDTTVAGKIYSFPFLRVRKILLRLGVLATLCRVRRVLLGKTISVSLLLSGAFRVTPRVVSKSLLPARALFPQNSPTNVEAKTGGILPCKKSSHEELQKTTPKMLEKMARKEIVGIAPKMRVNKSHKMPKKDNL